MGNGVRSPRTLELATVGVPVVVIVVTVATIASSGQDRETVTRLAQLSPVLQGVDILAGVSMIAAGTLAWVTGRHFTGFAAMVGGLCWFGADWAGNAGAPGALRGAGLVAASLTLPMIGWVLVTSWPSGTARTTRLPLLCSTAGLAILAVMWLVAWVPPLDPRCLAICDTNPLGAGIDFRLARTLANAWQGLTVALAIGIGAWALRMGSRASLRSRRQLGALLSGAAVVGAAWAVWGVTLLLPSTVVAPAGDAAALTFATRGIALIAFAAGLGWWIFRVRQVRDAVQRLADRMSPFPGAGTLSTGLAEAMGDPELRLVYALPADGGFVTEDGRPVGLDPASIPPDRLTEIRSGDEVVAVAIRSPEAAGEVVAPPFGPAVLLAADNERLLAAVRHELIELQASRKRIIETGDDARRRLERNLHDGAQQRMLGIIHDLAIARDAAVAAADTRAAGISGALAEADETTEALRTLARGIHPAMLEEAGLAAALETLADDAPVPLALEEVVEMTCNQTSKSAAWRLVAECVLAAARGKATAVRVAVLDVDGHLNVRIEIDALPEPLDTTLLEDVIGAAGGTLAAIRPAPDMLRIEAALPCA